ncbi:MAG: serine protease [Dinoroseobacter sp.]|nr:serine protease [Dinoroseobacter sp.]
MKNSLFALCVLFLAVTARPIAAQEQVFIQVEAQPTLAEAEQRARAYSVDFGNVVGYRLNSGWYAIAIGPFSAFDGERNLRNFRLLGEVPADSFISDGSGYAQQYWPAGATGAQPEAATVAQAPVPTRPLGADESPREARASEAALDRSAREALQVALKWYGFYNSTIDGAFGPGTRRAMSDYQIAFGDEATGVLTTGQRARLLSAYDEDISSLGMLRVESAETGIALEMPLGRVDFSRFEPPFAHYEGTQPTKALLISQEGTGATLRSLYTTLQTLEIIPREGPRSIGRDSFEIRGENGRIASYTYATLNEGLIKGFTLVWPREESRLMAKAADLMRDSFEPIDGVLDPALADRTSEQNVDLLAGLQVRKPLRTLSGFFVTETGDVLTTDVSLQTCGRITIGETEAQLQVADPDLGIVILSPQERLAPISVASFAQAPGRLQSDVAVAGYPYSGLLERATLSYGQLADLRGLQGQDTVSRLAIQVTPGDVGGPVLDSSGSVLGMLLPRAESGNQQLPEDVNFAAAAVTLANGLDAAGLKVARADTAGESLSPERLAQLAAGMTVLVSCWE